MPVDVRTAFAGSDARTRVGLAGINERARRLLLPGLVAAPRVHLAAVSSRDPTKAAQAAADLGGGVRAFAGVAEMARSGEVDAVFVNTPVAAHVEACLAALEAGCAVICEKPLAPDTPAALGLLRAAEQRGIRTAVNFTYRSVPGYRLTERLLRDGGIGVPLQAEFALWQGHTFLPGYLQASALLDSGVHLFDTLLGLGEAAGLGSVTSVCAVPLARGGPDLGWTFVARTRSGAAVSGQFSRRALGWRNGLRWSLYGESAAIVAELDADRTEVRLARRGDTRPQGAWRPVPLPADIAAGDARFPAFHMDRLVGAVRGEDSFPGFAEAVATHLLADALAASAQRGGWVNLPPRPTPLPPP